MPTIEDASQRSEWGCCMCGHYFIVLFDYLGANFLEELVVGKMNFPEL